MNERVIYCSACVFIVLGGVVGVVTHVATEREVVKLEKQVELNEGRLAAAESVAAKREDLTSSNEDLRIRLNACEERARFLLTMREGCEKELDEQLKRCPEPVPVKP